MQAETQGVQDPGVAKIRALLLAARPAILASARELATAFKQPLKAPGEQVTDQTPGVALLQEHLATLRAELEGTAVQGAAAVSARDLSVRALLETDQALGKLADTYGAPDQRSTTILLSESVRLLKEAKATGDKAGKALGIPWPLQ
jgi:hypothetical protein